MPNILLSADGPIRAYSVPEEIYANLSDWIDRFYDWMAHAPEAAALRQVFPSGTIGFRFTEEDFIMYLNSVAFPDQPSVLVEEMDADALSNLPNSFRNCPYYNF